MEPEDVTFQFLREITDDFSEEQKLGEGAFGVVYKGVTKTGEDVAVKKLRLCDANLNDKQFQTEFDNLRNLEHQNIVRILGYCYETEKKPFNLPDGSKVYLEETCRALCFEYMDNGSLQSHLSDEFCGLDWHTRFKIIMGTCEGIRYIHKDLEAPIYHLDIKPDNILLDKDMMPKIADFGLSRIFGKELTRTTENAYGTPGYQPPEYIDKGEISEKFDIFSLGVVMIRILSGPKGYPKCLEMPSDVFIDHVRQTWRNRLQATFSSDSLLEAYCHQAETCTQIALRCLDDDSRKRPDIVNITKMLNEIETGIAKVGQDECRMTMQNNKTEMRKESTDIIGLHQNLNLMLDNSSNQLEFDNGGDTSSDVVDELIVGRTEEKGKIMTSLLEGMSNSIAILPIHGIGGIGKTTFARLIYNDPEFDCYLKVWVDVSQRFDLNKICESVISQLSEQESQANEIKMIHSCLMRQLSSKKIMIVLDDLWEDNQFQLQKLKDMLYHDDSNILILVTTRSERVAERICTNLEPYKILPLTDEMCWDIIKKRSGFEARDDKEQLAGVGQEIAHKCGGVPLAARSLGFTLRSMNFDQWKRVKDSDIWNETISKDITLPNYVLASLMLSYSYMNLCLKPCFTYCGIFPKGHKIVKNDLIYQWISLDFIKPTKLLSRMQLCEKYIVQLLGLSFLQHSISTPKTSGTYYEEVISFTMHDLVHDLTRSIMGDKILDASKQINTGKNCCIYALLNDCSKSLELYMNCPDSLRALRFFQCAKVELCGAAFSPAKSLCVLDLSECCVQVLPDSIVQLGQLRYLNAPSIQDKTVHNCITGLSKLIYFSIPGSSAISELPVSFDEMINLMHLDLSGCSAIKMVPKSFGNLRRLMHLDLSNCSQVTGISEYLGNLTNLQYLNLSYCENIGKLPEALGSLSEVRYLNLSCSSYLEGHPKGHFLGTLTKLEYLNLSSKAFSCLETLPEDLGSFYQLKYLNLSGCIYLAELPKSLGKLNNLVFLDLSHCSNVYYGIREALDGLTCLKFLKMQGCEIDVGGLHKLKNLTELRYLNLSQCNLGNNHEIQMVIEHISALSNLEHLDLSYHQNLPSLPECLCNLRNLNTLNISGWNQLKEIPKSIQNIRSLKFVIADNCDELQYTGQFQLKGHFSWLPVFTVHIVDQSSSSLVELQDSNLATAVLEICSLENVMSTKEAQAVQLRKKHSITVLKLKWAPYAKRFVKDKEVLSELLPPVTLLRFTIQGYRGVRFPRWVMGIPEYLPNLVEIVMDTLPKCIMLPPLGKLPNLEVLHIGGMENLKKIDERFYGGTKAFPKLKELHIWSMQSLEEWDTMCSHTGNGVEELMFPSLESLEVLFCPKLRLSGCLPRAERWRIKESDNVLLSEGVEGLTCASSSPAVRSLIVQVESSKVPLYQWRFLHYLPAITSLEIIRCSYVAKSTPEIMQNLSSLQSLCLQGNDMPDRICRTGKHQWVISESLPKWLAELRSLKKIEISGYAYADIEVPMETMKNLSSLESLVVHECDIMTKLPRWLGALTTLKELVIRQMPELKKLHEGIHNLVSLKSLKVWSCQKLTILPEWLGDLSALEQLEIDDCSRIRCLPESLRRLSKLKKLDISGAKKISALPEWLVDLSALQELEINRCSGIKSLPASIQRLTKLSNLGTHGCPGLDRWRGLHELEKKLPDIKVYSHAKMLLEIDPPEIQLPFEVMKLVSCSLTLTNNTEKYIAYAFRPTEPSNYFTQPNSMGVVSPRSTCNLTVFLLAQKEAPPGMQCNDNVDKFIVQTVQISETDHIIDIMEAIFDQNTTDAVVDEVHLKVTYVAVPPSHPITSLNDDFKEGPHTHSSTDQRE